MSLSPSAIVVRGGVNRDAELLMATIADAIADGEGAVLSVFAAELDQDETIDQTLSRIVTIADIPHRKVQVATMGRLESSGVVIVLSVDEGEPSNHHHVVFREPLDIEQVKSFIAAFDEPIVSPTGGKQRGAAI